MSLRLLLTISGGLEALVGVLTLISPAILTDVLTGGPVDASTIVLARLFGAGVFALGLACLKARDDVRSPAGLAVSIGITSYNVLAAVVLTLDCSRVGSRRPVAVGSGDWPCRAWRSVCVSASPHYSRSFCCKRGCQILARRASSHLVSRPSHQSRLSRSSLILGGMRD